MGTVLCVPKYLLARHGNKLDKIYSSMRSELMTKQAIKIMSGLQSVMRKLQNTNLKQIEKLYKYFDEIDRRRNTHWRDLWPD